LSNTIPATTQQVSDPEFKVVFKPLAGAQELMLTCPAQRQLFVGTRGSGKTEVTLAHFRKYVGLGYGASLTGVYIALSYKALDDIIKKSRKLFGSFGDNARFLSAKGSYQWVFADGATLALRVVTNQTQYDENIHGIEYSHIYFNELSTWPNLEIYDMCHSSNRHSFVPERDSPIDENGVMQILPPLPTVSIATTNPSGACAKEIKARFVDVAPYGSIVKREMEVFNPKTNKIETMSKTQCAMFSSWIENPYLPPEYGMELYDISDPAKRLAWLTGQFSENDDSLIFGDCWDSKFNVVKDFIPPQNFRIFRMFDWGSSKPFSVQWVAISDGSDVTINGKTRRTVKNDCFIFSEIYGWNGKPDQGLRMLATQIAQLIIQRELDLGIYNKVKAGYADSSIFNSENGSCIADDMAEPVFIKGKKYSGVKFIPADKSPNTRPLGFERLRTAFANAREFEGVIREKPAIFVCEGCSEGVLRTVPSLPRDPKKDLDSLKSSEDHCFSGDTKVLLTDGTTPTIESLIGTNGLIQTSKGSQQYRNARLIKNNQRTIVLKFSDNSKVECTPDHMFHLKNGKTIRADKLKQSDDLLTSNNKNINFIDIVEVRNNDVYCLTVPATGNFALANGLIVSNCADVLRYLANGMKSSFTTTGRQSGYF